MVVVLVVVLLVVVDSGVVVAIIDGPFAWRLRLMFVC